MQKLKGKIRAIIAAIAAAGLTLGCFSSAYARSSDDFGNRSENSVMAVEPPADDTVDSGDQPPEDTGDTLPDDTEEPPTDDTEEPPDDTTEDTEEPPIDTDDDYGLYPGEVTTPDTETETETETETTTSTSAETTTATLSETTSETASDSTETDVTEESSSDTIDPNPPIIVLTTPPLTETSSDNSSDSVSDSSSNQSESTPPPASDTETLPPETDRPVLVLTYYTFNLQIGQAAPINWHIENGTADGNEARYYSSNPAVASVDASGVIAAAGAGSAEITVTVGELTASAAVNVSAPAAEAEGISVTETSYSLKIGESVYIQAAVVPAEAAGRYTIAFSSDNADVAEVDENGIITAKSPGEANITASCLNTEFAETIHVTVSNEEMIYEKAKLEGCLYGIDGTAARGVEISAGGISAITDENGYFVFESLDKKETVLRISENGQSTVFPLNGNSAVWLLYGNDTLECFSDYREISSRFAISLVTFEAAEKSVRVGDVYIPYYKYEPSSAAINQIQYISSDQNVAAVDQNGVITAKSMGEAIITLILNGGQAQAFFTLTVNPEETGKYTAVIAAAETAVLAAAAAAAAAVYKNYKKKNGESEEVTDLDGADETDFE